MKHDLGSYYRNNFLVEVLSEEHERESKGPTYSSWEQVAGYFDGDGNVGLDVVKRVLRFKIRFVDTWKPQIVSIARFLFRQGISCGKVGKGDKRGVWQPAYRLDISEIKSVINVAKAMSRYTVKKQAELQIAIDYLEGRITGTDAITAFNREVESGRRRGRIRFEDLPYTRDEGIRLSQLENARNARAAYAVKVSPSIREQIRLDHTKKGLGHLRLSKKYGYSVSVIRRILGAR
jgi:hypothetical protein